MEEARPVYIDHFSQTPDAVLTHLLTLNWLQVTEARLEYFMSTEPREYTYGKGDFARTYKSEAYTPTVVALMDALNVQGHRYNVCFLNRYDTQKHQLGWHSDDSPTMDRNHPIAVISFGAEREIWWRKIGDKGVVPPENRQKLGLGSLFVMPAGFQDTHQHRIPRSDRECKTRISLTFRRYQ